MTSTFASGRHVRQLAWLAILAVTACSAVSTVPAPATVALRFAPADSVVIDTVGTGIVHYRVRRSTGPFNIQIVTVPTRSRYEFVAARAHDSLRGRERVSDMVRRRQARGERIRVALNADFFDLKTGANENNQIVDGQVWKANPVTDSPFDTFRNSHTQFAVDAAGRPYLERFSYAGALDGACGHFVLDGVNGVPRVPNALILFSAAAADAPRRDSLRTPRELPVRATAGSRAGGGDLELLPFGGARDTPASIAQNQAVLAAYGTAGARLDSIARCASPLRVTHQFRPDRGRLTAIVGGWPRVVQDGRNVGGASDSVEGTFPNFSAKRHPRSAVGFSRDSTTIYLIAVDGRQETSDGMTLVELGDFLVSIGVYQGLNFDGGGSTALVIDGKVVNRPSDAAGERTVGNAILVRER
jgi:exopolysaccharide biosynthesis protein